MKRLTILLLLLSFPLEAHALSFNDLLSRACGESGGISSFFGLDDFCRVATVLQQGGRAEGFLSYVKDKLFDASIGTLFNALDPSSKMPDAIKGVLGDLTETIRKAYNLPYEVLNEITNVIQGEIYRLTRRTIASGYENIATQLTQTIQNNFQSQGVTLVSPQDLEEKFKGAGTYGDRAPEGYDSATINALSSNLQFLSSSMEQVANGNKETLISTTETLAKNILPELEAEASAKRAEEKARKQAYTAAQAAAGKAIGEKGAALASKVAEVAVDKKDPSGQKILEPSLASQYKERAKKAASDRELLQIQVEAIADLMRNSALTEQLTAEYLRAALSQQVLSTEALREEVKLLRKELVGEQNPGMGVEGLSLKVKQAIEEIENERKRALEQISPAISAIDALCTAYGLGSCWEEYKAEVEGSRGRSSPNL